MLEGVDWVLKQPPNKGEYFLTDAFQYMIDKGAKLKVIDVEGWYDAGKLDTLLETNRSVLEKRGAARRPSALGGDVKVFDPVYIEDGVTLRNCTVGPNVSIGRGTTVQDSQLRDSIVGDKARIVGSQIANSLIGDHAVVEGLRGELTVADHSEVRNTK
jgi:glucose-1-phosphate thymidylyltransferase